MKQHNLGIRVESDQYLNEENMGKTLYKYKLKDISVR